MTTISGRVLITGATGGIGHAITRAFAARGATLVLSGRRVEVLEPLAQQVGAATIAADLSSRADLERLVASAGPLDILVVNHALPGTGVFPELSQPEIDRVLEVNLAAPLALARAVLPAMLERRSGHIVFISSLSGKAASPDASLYNATKFGLRGFGLALREDLHGTGVSASVVSPGFIAGAGMFHDAGVTLPRGVGTRSPEQVAAGVLKAVRRNRAEVIVAPLGLRIGADLAGIAPQISGFVQRFAGGNRIAHDLSAGQLHKRG